MHRMLQVAGVAALLLAGMEATVTSGALAQSRPSTLDGPCIASQRLVAARGAVVLGTGPNTYDRFVRDRTFCLASEYTETAYAPAADTPQCFIGFRCVAGPRELFNR